MWLQRETNGKSISADCDFKPPSFELSWDQVTKLLDADIGTHHLSTSIHRAPPPPSPRRAGSFRALFARTAPRPRGRTAAPRSWRSPGREPPGAERESLRARPAAAPHAVDALFLEQGGGNAALGWRQSGKPHKTKTFFCAGGVNIGSWAPKIVVPLVFLVT